MLVPVLINTNYPVDGKLQVQLYNTFYSSSVAIHTRAKTARRLLWRLLSFYFNTTVVRVHVHSPNHPRSAHSNDNTKQNGWPVSNTVNFERIATGKIRLDVGGQHNGGLSSKSPVITGPSDFFFRGL